MARTRIIAVDDDRRILRVLKRACETVGYEVHSVLDAEFFESAFRVFEPELVFLDLSMDRIDGFELLRFMARERTETRVIVTSGVDEQLLRSAHALGLSLGLRMMQPIRKPLMVADIRRRLKTFHEQPGDEQEGSISEEELVLAMQRNRIEVWYQPMVKLATGEVVCAEALARIRRNDGGLVPPARFIPLAERSGRIEELTYAVLRPALENLLRWRSVIPDLQMAVNLSPSLLHDASIAEGVSQALGQLQVDPRSLVLEVTQTGAEDTSDRMGSVLARLQKVGVRLSLDDFGAGFSSLGQLYEFPYEALKLDRKFAIRARSSSDAAATIRSCLDLARSVGLTVVAEGIQSEESLLWLGSLGCDVGQGFHISPPLSATAFRDWLRRRRHLGAAPPQAIAV